MCRIFSGQPADRYGFQTRSVRLSGHVTSIRLEAAFWAILEEIAGREGATLAKFLTELHDEVLEFEGESTNFASLLRCACLTYVEEARTGASADPALLRPVGRPAAIKPEAMLRQPSVYYSAK